MATNALMQLYSAQNPGTFTVAGQDSGNGTGSIFDELLRNLGSVPYDQAAQMGYTGPNPYGMTGEGDPSTDPAAMAQLRQWMLDSGNSIASTGGFNNEGGNQYGFNTAQGFNPLGAYGYGDNAFWNGALAAGALAGSQFAGSGMGADYGGADAATLGAEYGGGGVLPESTGSLSTMGAYQGGSALPATAQLSPALSSPSLMSSLGSMVSSPYGLGQLGSAAIGLYGNNQAIGAYQDATNQANGLAQQQLDYTKQINAPLVGLRDSVLPQINALLSNPSSITSDPGYQFGLKQGADQLNNRAAASGSYYSGGQMKAAQRYGQDYAGTKLDQSLNRLTTVAGLGQVGANNAQQGFTQGTNALAGNALNMGNARGSLYGGNAGLVGGALGNIFNENQYRDMWGKGP